MAAPAANKKEKKSNDNDRDSKLRTGLSTEEKQKCLIYLYSLGKKLVGSQDQSHIETLCITVRFPDDTGPFDLKPYQIAYLVYHGPVPEGRCISHRCAHDKTGYSPCVNPLHMEHDTRKGNRGRDAHQKGLVDYVKRQRGAKGDLGKDKFVGPLFVVFKDDPKLKNNVAGSRDKPAIAVKTFHHLSTAVGKTCYHLELGDCCFINVGKLQSTWVKGLVFFKTPKELQKEVDEVNAMMGKTEITEFTTIQ